MYVTNERALIDHSPRRIASDCPTLFPLGGELKFLVDAVASRHNALVRWFLRPGRGLRVSPMSSAWLRMHEAEHIKHETWL
jgi:hypothetical protein